MSAAPPLRFASAVRAALDAGRPVVALESTLVTHGLAWPRNLDAARTAEAAVREAGAEPATIAALDGELLIGLDDDQLQALAMADGAAKASRATLATALHAGGWAGTTVAATMIAAHLCGIRVFATGGIGGVHRGATSSFDISADLDELSRTPVLVVCSGPKSILDVDLTLEYLETRGVPVVGWGTSELAGFFARESGRQLSVAVDGPDAAADICYRHWQLGLASGLLVSVPVPAEAALSRLDAERLINRAIADAEGEGIRGPAATPWLLARIAALSDGRSVTANLALIENNSRVAGQIAAELSRKGA